MENTAKKSRFRLGVIDVVVIIAVVALLVALIFRFTSDSQLFTHDTAEYLVSVKAASLNYTTIDMLSSDDAVYLESGEKLGAFSQSPTVTPALKYVATDAGEMLPVYYPDNTLVDLTTVITCELISKDGFVMTKNGVHIAPGVVLEIHTTKADLLIEITAVETKSDN